MDLNQVARTPRGAGRDLTYQPYDSVAGLAPGAAAILFLAGIPDDVAHGPDTPPHLSQDGVYPCPFGTTPASRTATTVGNGTGFGQAFHLTSDRPVVAYEMNPFGGGFSAIPAATLLLPSENWTNNNIAAAPMHPALSVGSVEAPTILLITAAEDQTEVTVRAQVSVQLGSNISGSNSGKQVQLTLNAGQFVQLIEVQPSTDVESPGLSGAVVTSSKPVALTGGSPCAYVGRHACDEMHQQIPALSAWGIEYAAVRYRDRSPMSPDEVVPWQLVGAVDGTVLTYLPKVPTPAAPFGGGLGTRTGPALPAPTTLKAGQSIQFWTAEPFIVRSQDDKHPFYLAGFMTGGRFLTKGGGPGDAEFVNVVPTSQYLTNYTFFTDPTYNETSLVVIRKPGNDGRYADVKLDCASSPVSGWTNLGMMQYARVDLVTRAFSPVIPGCNNGVQKMASQGAFAVTVWGWSSPDGGLGLGGFASYAYPVGAAQNKVNLVIP